MSNLISNLLPLVKSLTFKSDVSKKTDNEYEYIDIVFKNNYSLRVFPSREQKFIISSMTKKSSQIEVKSDDDAGDDLDFLEV